MKIITTDGRELPAGVCVTPDHYMQTFVVQVRSIRQLSADNIKDLIQAKHEVTSIKEEPAEAVIIVRGGQYPNVPSLR